MDLCREILGLKWFITGHQKKIEIRLLAIAQEQIFADRGVVAKGVVLLYVFIDESVILLYGYCQQRDI